MGKKGKPLVMKRRVSLKVPRQRQSARPAKPLGFHAEGAAPESEVNDDIAARAFWEQWDTALLAAWELDFAASAEVPALAPLKVGHREYVIDALVQRKRARPKEGEELAQLQLVWRKQMSLAADAAAPGLADHPLAAASSSKPPAKAAAAEAHSAPAARASEEEVRVDEEGDMDEDSEDDQPAKRQRTDSSPSDPSPTAERQQIMQYEGITASGLGARVTATHPLQVCLTCACERPPAQGPGGPLPHTSLMWLCACGRRGDLPFDDGLNRDLMSTRLALSARTTESSSSAGTSSGTATNPDSALSKRDRHFKLLLARAFPTQPAFSFSPAPGTTPHGPVQAVIENMKAHLAAENDPPSVHLIALIRAGKLTEVGFALPRALNEAPDDEKNAQFGFSITNGVWAETTTGTTAPPVPSAQAFCMALFSTILPALVDMPAALSQWFALGRTALQLERTRGWQAADSYVRQVLNQCRNLGLDMAPTHMSCLLNTLAGSAAAGHGGGGAAPHRIPIPNQSASHPARPAETCHQWNFGPHGCVYPNCRHQHRCAGCGGDHKGSTCARGVAEKERREARRAGGGHSSSGSVRTAPASGSNRPRERPAASAAPAPSPSH